MIKIAENKIADW